jgi:hypothetical protein
MSADDALRTLNSRYQSLSRRAEQDGDEDASERFDRLREMTSGLLSFRRSLALRERAEWRALAGEYSGDA